MQPPTSIGKLKKYDESGNERQSIACDHQCHHNSICEVCEVYDAVSFNVDGSTSSVCELEPIINLPKHYVAYVRSTITISSTPMLGLQRWAITIFSLEYEKCFKRESDRPRKTPGQKEGLVNSLNFHITKRKRQRQRSHISFSRKQTSNPPRQTAQLVLQKN